MCKLRLLHLISRGPKLLSSPLRGVPVAVDVPNFEAQFARFRDDLYLRHGDAPFSSFWKGAAKAWEGYKLPLRDLALTRLDPASWSEGAIGSGNILEGAISAIEIGDREQYRNNLLAWDGRFGPASAAHAPLLAARTDPKRRRAMERWLYEAFVTREDDAALFEAFRGLAGDGYPLAAYLFFLIDADRFAPIGPQTFDAAFGLLGIDLTTSGRCSWDNYRQFNDALDAIQVCLAQKPRLTGARHIDAHSFCWMLIKMEEVASGRGKAGAVRYAGARTKHLFRMAYTAAQTAAASGKRYTATRKDKEIHHDAQELQAVISRLLKEQSDLCALTNLPLQWPEEGDDPAFFASLDRIDSSGHYADGNLQVVCRFANGWKSDTADGEFRRLLAIVREVKTQRDVS